MCVSTDTVPVCWVRPGCSPVSYSFLWQVFIVCGLHPGTRPLLRLAPEDCHMCQHL